MSKYEAVYFVGDNQANNRIRVDSYKTRNRGAFSGSLAALHKMGLGTCFYPTALKGCWGIVFTHGGQVAGKSLSGLYLRNRKV